jgi:hypothetical protein
MEAADRSRWRHDPLGCSDEAQDVGGSAIGRSSLYPVRPLCKQEVAGSIPAGSTHEPIETITPLSSASGMNLSGATIPRVG